MDHTLFYEITSVLLLAGVIALVTSLFRQPSIMAFILTGLIVGPFGYWQLQSSSVLQGLGEIGIALLLFMVGLELDVKRIRQLGKVAVYTGLGQILFTALAGFAIVKLMGFSVVSAVYIAVALTFSSTIIVVKLLSEKRELQSLYARIVVGFLIVQDFVALGILVLLGGTQGHDLPILTSLPVWQLVMITAVKGLLLFLLLWFLSRKVFPKLLLHLGRSEELLLAFSIAWALGFAAFASLPGVGLSLEVGGFLAGLALANSQAYFEISARVKSIRDFFLIIFFIVFGTQLVFTNVAAIIWPAVLLSLFVLVGNPVILMVIMGRLGYKPRTSFFASVTVAQVSEFSFILVALGYRLGHIPSDVVALVTLVGVITISVSSYMILYTKELYRWLKQPLEVFDFGGPSAERGLVDLTLSNHVVLVGAHRLGEHLIQALSTLKSPLVIVDFDPEVAERYAGQGYQVVCGDITDGYIQDQVNLGAARLVISTVPDLESNLALVDAVRRASLGRKARPKLICAAQNELEARHLYEREIDYAISPHFIGGQHLAHIIEHAAGSRELKRFRDEHLKVLAGAA